MNQTKIFENNLNKIQKHLMNQIKSKMEREKRVKTKTKNKEQKKQTKKWEQRKNEDK